MSAPSNIKRFLLNAVSNKSFILNIYNISQTTNWIYKAVETMVFEYMPVFSNTLNFHSIKLKNIISSYSIRGSVREHMNVDIVTNIVSGITKSIRNSIGIPLPSLTISTGRILRRIRILDFNFYNPQTTAVYIPVTASFARLSTLDSLTLGTLDSRTLGEMDLTVV